MGKSKLKNNDLLKYLGTEDRSLFLDDLLTAIDQSRRDGSFDAIEECIDQWEDTVEMLSIPGLKNRVWESYNKLIASGVIKKDGTL